MQIFNEKKFLGKTWHEKLEIGIQRHEIGIQSLFFYLISLQQKYEQNFVPFF